MILLALSALITMAVFYGMIVSPPVIRDTLFNAWFFSFNWWGTYFMAIWITKRMKKDSKRALFEIYLNKSGWKLQLNFRNAERILIERPYISVTHRDLSIL
jgi:hypothetical protein